VTHASASRLGDVVDPLTPAAAPGRPRLWRRVWSHVVWTWGFLNVAAGLAVEALWKRRWKLAGLAALYAIGRSCQYLPEAAQPLCELLVRALGSVP
jgi:hypothetical protein